MNEYVSCYWGVTPKTAGKMTWQNVLQQIKDGKHKDKIEKARSFTNIEDYREYKKTLPAVTFCAMFNGRRNKDSVINATGFIIPDLDHVQDIEKTFETLIQDEKNWFVFRSPSSTGLKCALRATDIKNDEDIKKFYSSVERYFKEVYGITIDPACKDISRLTFLSYDPNMWVNPNPYFFDIDAWYKDKRVVSSKVDTTNTQGKQKYAQKVLQSCIDEIEKSQPGSQHQTRLRCAKLVGGYLHYLDYNEIYNALKTAVTNSGAKNLDAALKTVRDGLSYGQQEPIILEDTKNQPLWINETNETNASNETNKNSHILTELTPTNGGLTKTNGTNAQLTPKKDRFSGNLTGHIREYVQENQGSFTNQDIDREFNITHPADKNLRRQVLAQLNKELRIKKDVRVAGKYHIIQTELNFIDLDQIEESYFSLNLPLGLQQKINLPQKCVVVIAGTSNSGKTSLLIQILKENLHQQYPLMYLMSEMGPSEYKQRVQKMLEPGDVGKWKKKVKATSMTTGFDGAITQYNPDGVTCIDFLEDIGGEYYKLASDIRAIYDALGTGIAIIAMQKHSKAEVARGGEGTTEKARLYMTLDKLAHQPRSTITALKIHKAKDYPEDNPNGLECHVEIRAGQDITPITDWMYCNKKQREQYIAKYEHMIEQGMDAPAQGKNDVIYRFLLDDGSYGNLRRKDFEKWMQSYPDADVENKLADLAEWSQHKPLKKKKNGWFFQLSRILENEQKT